MVKETYWNLEHKLCVRNPSAKTVHISLGSQKLVESVVESKALNVTVSFQYIILHKSVSGNKGYA